MRIAPALVVVSLVFGGTAVAAGGGAASAAAAKSAVELAQKNLDEAVKRIEKDPPSNADLESAHAAVEALKSAIDSGAAFEEQDLEYAKTALSARKELRDQRQYVEERRAKVHIFDERRKLDAALATLETAAQRTEPKSAAAKDFDDAHAAAAALEKELQVAQEFAKQDASFAKYLSETRSTLEHTQKAVDDRWAALELDKHKVRVQQARDALSSAVAPLEKSGTDAQFDAASRASADLAKLLDEGKPFESRDKSYRSDADRARSELAQAKKTMDAYVASVGLAKLKADIEPARLELVDSQKALHGKNPSADELATAKTAAFVVSKLVEKSQSKADVNPAFAKYLEDCKATLADVEAQLQLRALQAARKDLTEAMKPVEKRAATDEDFQAANTALTILEKTLETVHGKEPAIQSAVADARQHIKDVKSRLELRHYQVDLQRQHDKLAEALKNADAAVKKIWDAKVDDAVLNQADAAVKALDPVLEQGKPLTHKDADYRDFDKKVRDRQHDLAERIVNRRVQLAAQSGRSKLGELISSAKGSLDAAEKPEATDAEVDTAAKSVDAIPAAIEANAKLEKQDKGYAAQADRARGELQKLTEQLAFAKDARALRKQLAEALAAGNAAVDAGGKSSDPNTQKDQYEKALRSFQSCATDGASTVSEKPALAKIVVLVDGSPNLPKEVMATCTKRIEATQPLVDQATALAYFHNGPKKDFEMAKAQLTRGDRTAAKSNFAECIADGRIFAHRYPAMKDTAFDVAGAKLNAEQLIAQCIKERDALK